MELNLLKILMPSSMQYMLLTYNRIDLKDVTTEVTV